MTINTEVHLNLKSTHRRFTVTAKSFGSFELVTLTSECTSDIQEPFDWMKCGEIEFFCIKGTGENLAAALKAATGK